MKISNLTVTNTYLPNRKPPLHRVEIMDIISKLAIYTIRSNVYMNTWQHVQWVIKGFENLENTCNKVGIKLDKIPNLTKCPRHGWVDKINLSTSNSCIKCYRNNVLYKKKVKFGKNGDGLDRIYE